jgi:hypothetical protein
MRRGLSRHRAREEPPARHPDSDAAGEESRQSKSPDASPAKRDQQDREGPARMLRSVESHVIPAKAGIQLVLSTWTPACAGVTKA